MTEDLKHCPYCGGKAVIRNTQIDDKKGYKEYIIGCENCGILSGFCDDKQKIIDKWNARAEKMLSCPFCGGKGVICEHDIGDWKNYAVICEDCGMTASPEDSEADAILAWNKRV